MRVAIGCVGFILGYLAGWYAYPDPSLHLRFALAFTCGYALLCITVPSLGRPQYWLIIMCALLIGASYRRWLGEAREALGLIATIGGIVYGAELAVTSQRGRTKAVQTNRRLILAAVGVGTALAGFFLITLAPVPLPVSIVGSLVGAAIALWVAKHLQIRESEQGINQEVGP